MFVIGLTGLIGSGKSTVAAIFAEHGIHVIDTDVVAHKLTAQNGAAIPALRETFGEHVVCADNSLDRNLMRELVFSDSNARLKLEQVLHPMILADVQEQLGLVNSIPYSIVVVPLLFRSKNYQALTKRNIFVDCEYSQLLERVRKRSNLDKIQVDAILSQQVKREEQLKLADDIIENNGDLESLNQQINNLHNKYLLLR